MEKFYLKGIGYGTYNPKWSLDELIDIYERISNGSQLRELRAKAISEGDVNNIVVAIDDIYEISKTRALDDDGKEPKIPMSDRACARYEKAVNALAEYVAARHYLPRRYGEEDHIYCVVENGLFDTDKAGNCVLHGDDLELIGFLWALTHPLPLVASNSCRNIALRNKVRKAFGETF